MKLTYACCDITGDLSTHDSSAVSLASPHLRLGIT